MKSGKMSNDLVTLSDLKEKLFLYFRMAMNQSDNKCQNSRCTVNLTNKHFFISNVPMYIVTSLFPYSSTSISDLLKIFLLIPRLFELSSLFENNRKTKVFYELSSGVLVRSNHLFLSFSKVENSIEVGKIWQIQDNRENILFSNYYDFVSYSISNRLSPVMLVFSKIENKYIDNDREITNEEIEFLESYTLSVEDYEPKLNSRLRPVDELLIRYENNRHLNASEECKLSLMQTKYFMNSSNEKVVIPSSAQSENIKINDQARLSNQLERNSFICSFCKWQNFGNLTICTKCSKDNNPKEIIKNSKSSNSYVSEIKNEIPNKNIAEVKSNESQVANKISKNKSKSNNIDMPKQIIKPKLVSTSVKRKPSDAKPPIACQTCKSKVCMCKAEIEAPKIKNSSNAWTCQVCNSENAYNKYKCNICKNLNPTISKEYIIRKDKSSKVVKVLDRPNSSSKLMNEGSASNIKKQPTNTIKPGNCICYGSNNREFFINGQCYICKRSVDLGG